jgi:ribulose-phosphate 3-epimerase
MVDAPASFFDELADAGLDVVSFHHEAVSDPEATVDKARAAGLGVGVTIKMETPTEEVFPYLDRVDDVMLMSIEPGWSGQTLDPGVYPRLERVRDEIDRRGLEIDVEIDGGVKVDNARRAVDAGATVLVSASGVFQAADPTESARQLRAIANGEAV